MKLKFSNIALYYNTNYLLDTSLETSSIKLPSFYILNNFLGNIFIFFKVVYYLYHPEES